MKATLTVAGGKTIQYAPVAVISDADEQFLLMHVEEGILVEQDVLLFRIDRHGEGFELTMVEDLHPYAHLIEQTMGIAPQSLLH